VHECAVICNCVSSLVYSSFSVSVAHGQHLKSLLFSHVQLMMPQNMCNTHVCYNFEVFREDSDGMLPVVANDI
jgi:hypothetical protein